MCVFNPRSYSVVGYTSDFKSDLPSSSQGHAGLLFHSVYRGILCILTMCVQVPIKESMNSFDLNLELDHPMK